MAETLVANEDFPDYRAETRYKGRSFEFPDGGVIRLVGFVAADHAIESPN